MNTNPRFSLNKKNEIIGIDCCGYISSTQPLATPLFNAPSYIKIKDDKGPITVYFNSTGEPGNQIHLSASVLNKEINGSKITTSKKGKNYKPVFVRIRSENHYLLANTFSRLATRLDLTISEKEVIPYQFHILEKVLDELS